MSGSLHPLGALGVLGEGLIELAIAGESSEPVLGFGGDASNISVMAARLGAEARLLGRVGADGFGGRLMSLWRSEGVDVGAILEDASGPTGLYVNEVAEDGHRFTYYRRDSAGSHLAVDDLADSFFSGLGLVAVTGVTMAISEGAAEAAARAVKRAAAQGIPSAFVLNYRAALGPDLPALRRLASQCGIVIGSVEDAEAVFGVSDAESLAAALGEGSCEVILTRGEQSALLWVEGTSREQPVPEVRAVNAAGAGDALAGAYLARRLAGHHPAEALRWGVAAASLSVQGEGCVESYPDLRQVRARVDAPQQPHRGVV